MVGREGGKLGPSRVGVISQRPAEPGPDTGHVNTTPLTHHNLIDNLRAPILFADVYSGNSTVSPIVETEASEAVNVNNREESEGLSNMALHGMLITETGNVKEKSQKELDDEIKKKKEKQVLNCI